MTREFERGPGPSGLEFTPEGWVADDLEFFRLVMDHPAPRPYSYLTQLKDDARAWRPWAFWVAGAAAIALAVLTEQWWLVAVGVCVLAIWFSMFRNLVRQVRNCQIVIGVVETLAPHPLYANGKWLAATAIGGGWATAQALVADKGQVPVVLLPRLADAIRYRQGPAEVAILYTPRSQFSLVIGVRPLPLGSKS